MKRALTVLTALILSAAMLAGCGSTPMVVITTLPSAAAAPSATDKVMPTVLPSPTPSPEEQIEIHKKNIPDIIEGDSRNSGNIYEDDKYIYFMENIAFHYESAYVPGVDDDNDSYICKINKTTGEYALLFKHCSGLCAEGEKIYWVEDDYKKDRSYIKQYDKKTKKNTLIYSTETETSIAWIEAGNDRLFYTTLWINETGQPEYELYSVDKNGGNNEKLIDKAGVSFIRYKDYIIYISYDNAGKPSLYKYNIAGGNITKLCDYIYHEAFGAAHGKVYFLDVDEGCVVSVDIVSGEKKIFRDANSIPIVLGQYLFYTNTRQADGNLRRISDNGRGYGDITELRAYDMTSGEYYYVTSDDSLFLDAASNTSLYFYDGNYEHKVILKSLTIQNGKMSVKTVMEYEAGDR